MAAGSGLTSHIYACICIFCTGTILYAAPCKLLEQCLFLAAPCTHRHVYLAQHAASPRLQVVTLAASPRPLVCRNRVCLLASHVTVLYGGRQNACIISSNRTCMVSNSCCSARPTTDSPFPWIPALAFHEAHTDYQTLNQITNWPRHSGALVGAAPPTPRSQLELHSYSKFLPKNLTMAASSSPLLDNLLANDCQASPVGGLATADQLTPSTAIQIVQSMHFTAP